MNSLIGFAAARQLVIAAFLCLLAGPAYAYIGPGAGLTAIGTVLALGAAILLAIVGFVWYPVKRLRQSRKAAAAEEQKPTEEREESL